MLTYAIVGYFRSLIFFTVGSDSDDDDDEDPNGSGGSEEGSFRVKKQKWLTLEEMQKVADDRKSAYSSRSA